MSGWAWNRAEDQKLLKNPKKRDHNERTKWWKQTNASFGRRRSGFRVLLSTLTTNTLIVVTFTYSNTSWSSFGSNWGDHMMRIERQRRSFVHDLTDQWSRRSAIVCPHIYWTWRFGVWRRRSQKMCTSRA